MATHRETRVRFFFFIFVAVMVEKSSCEQRGGIEDTTNSSRTFSNYPHRRHRNLYGHHETKNKNNLLAASDEAKIEQNSRTHPQDKKNEATVETKLGTLEGLVQNVDNIKVHAYLGVRFGEAPTGQHRFKAAAPAKKWSGVNNAKKLAPSCYQGQDNEYGDFSGSDMWNAKNEKTEDCLFMNIWTPADVKNTTVMVWLFGGGFWYGSASLDIYNAKALAAYGNVTVVVPNYRLGAFGFLYLDHPDVPGNVGLLDQQLALRWIQDNIHAFNGDPTHVSLFGESAGAASIVAHMVSKESWPLFRSGILQSGSLDNPWAMDTPQRALQKSKEIAAKVKCNFNNTDQIVRCLRNKTAEELDSQIWNITLGYLEFPLVIVSKDRAGFFKKDAYKLLRERAYRPHTDLMIGINKDEGTFWMVYGMLKPFFEPKITTYGGAEKHINESTFEECINLIFKGQPQVYRSGALWEYRRKEQCPDKQDPAFYRDQLNQLIGDYYFTCDSLWLANETAQDGNGGRVYVYNFEQRIGTNPWDKWMGVMHGYEIEFVFGLPLLQPVQHKDMIGQVKKYSEEDRRFTKDIIEYWTSFARLGKPQLKNNTGNKSDWSQYTAKDNAWFLLNATQQTRYGGSHKDSECKMWRSVRDIQYTIYAEKHLSGSSQLGARLGTILAMISIIVIISQILFSN